MRKFLARDLQFLSAGGPHMKAISYRPCGTRHRAGALRRAAVVSLLVVIGLAGCDAYLVADDGYAEVAVAPPAARVEIVPPLPYAGAIWVGGRWVWRGGRHVWVAGRYMHPRRGYVYAPHVWTPGPHGRWHYAPPRWRRR